MRRLWPVSLVILLAACGNAPPNIAGPRMPDYSMMGDMGGMGDGGWGMPGGGGFGAMAGGPAGMGLDQSLARPLGGSLSGSLGGASGGGALGGGNLLGDMPAFEGLMSHGAVVADTEAKEAPGGLAEPDKGKPEIPTSAHGLLISSTVRCNPEQVLVKFNRAGSDDLGDLTLVVPVQGKTKVRHAKSGKTFAWEAEGVATARLRLAKSGDNAAKPVGAAPIVMHSATAAPFAIAQVTIQAEGHPDWTITDLNAIIPYAEVPNLAPGTKVTVSVTLKGDATGALPFLLTSSDDDGKIMHLWQKEAEKAADGTTTYSRSFTLHQANRSISGIRVRANVGFIGIKVVDKKALLANEGVRAVGLLLKFPSDKDGPAVGYQHLKVSPELKRHVQKILQTIDEAEAKRPSVSGADL